MAARLTDKAIEAINTNSFDWEGGSFKAMLINKSFNASANGINFISDIPRKDRVSSPVALSNTRIVGDSYDADDILFDEVKGKVVGSIIIYQDMGTEHQSPLMLIMDSGYGLPLAPNYGDVIVRYPTGNMRLF